MSDFVNITRNNNDIISTYTNNQNDEGGDEGIAGLAAQLADRANLNTFVWNDSSVDNTAAFNNALLTGQKISLKPGTLTIKGRIRLDLAPHNSYVIEGCGENTVLNFVGATAGFYDIYGSQDGRNYHIKAMKNLLLQGDGTNTGIEFASLQGDFQNIELIGFNKALYIHDGGYGSHFDMFKFQNNIWDIYFGNAVNALSITNINIDGHTDITGAGICFEQPVTCVKITGTIESCHAPAIWYKPSFSGQLNLELYCELIGDNGQGVPAIKNESTLNRVSYENCTFPHDVTPWTTGDYQIGNNPSIRNSQVYAAMKKFNTLSLRDCEIGQDGTIITDNPVIFSGLNTIHPVWAGGGTYGVVMQIPLAYQGNVNNPFTDTKLDPWCGSGINVVASGVQPPVLTYDSTNTLFGNKSTQIAFVNGQAGNASQNFVYFKGNYASATLDPGNLYVCSFFAKANQIGDIEFRIQGDIVGAFASITLDTTWRKYVVIGHNYTGVAKANMIPYLTGGTAKTGFVVNVTGGCIYENIPYDIVAINEFLKGNFKY